MRPELTTWKAVFNFKKGQTLSRKTILQGIKHLQFLSYYLELSVDKAMFEIGLFMRALTWFWIIYDLVFWCLFPRIP